MTFWNNPLDPRSYGPPTVTENEPLVYVPPIPNDYSDMLTEILSQLIILTDMIAQTRAAPDPKADDIIKQLRRVNSNLERGLKLPHIPE